MELRPEGAWCSIGHERTGRRLLEENRGLQVSQELLSVVFSGSWDHQPGQEGEAGRLGGGGSWPVVQS